MKVEILGSGCANCQKVYASAQEAVQGLALDDAVGGLPYPGSKEGGRSPFLLATVAVLTMRHSLSAVMPFRSTSLTPLCVSGASGRAIVGPLTEHIIRWGNRVR